jgi:hypothetical protein
MKELKTLKDFTDKECYSDFIPISGKSLLDIRRNMKKRRFIPEEKLKAEAIKCAKYFDKKMEETGNGEIDQMGFLYWKGRFDEVMERNNLTEEDLK